MIKVPDIEDDAILVMQCNNEPHVECSYYVIVYHLAKSIAMLKLNQIDEFYDILNSDDDLLLNVDHVIYGKLARYCITNKIKYYKVKEVA